MFDLWNEYLYKPVFNLLIWIYNNWTDQNLGWAVVYLTILLRLALLPFTLLTEKTQAQNVELEHEVEKVMKEFKQDPVQQKMHVRKILKKRKVRPFARIIVIGVQLLVLILLYQVFIRGISGRNLLEYLYPSVEIPGTINTNFYGFELGETHTLFWPLVVGLVLFFEIYLEYRHQKDKKISQANLAYLLVFPVFSFLALWMLPMVKSLFILTSSLFSDIIHQFSKTIFAPKDKKSGH